MARTRHLRPNFGLLPRQRYTFSIRSAGTPGWSVGPDNGHEIIRVSVMAPTLQDASEAVWQCRIMHEYPSAYPELIRELSYTEY